MSDLKDRQALTYERDRGSVVALSRAHCQLASAYHADPLRISRQLGEISLDIIRTARLLMLAGF
jgi:hypothetical protein